MNLLSAFMQNKRDANLQNKKVTLCEHSHAAGKIRQLNDIFLV